MTGAFSPVSVTPRAALEQFLRSLDTGDWETMRNTYAPDAEIIFPGTPVLDPDGLVEVCQHFRSAFPDISHSIASAVEAERAVGAEIVAIGTNTGPLISEEGETPPTGRQVTFRAAQIVATNGDVITKHHVYYDQMDVVSQLGLD